MAGLDTTLEKVVNGKYDLAAAKAEDAKRAAEEEKEMVAQKKLQQLAKLITAGKDDAETKKLEDELVALDKEQGGILGGQPFKPADFRKRVLFMPKFQQYQQAMMSGQSEAQLADLEKELVATAPEGFDLAFLKTMIRNQVELQKVTPLFEAYLEAVGENGDPAKAADALAKIDAAKIQSGMALNQLAWSILTSEEVKKRDLPAALRFAKQANDLAKGEEAAILDTYARALFDNGKTQDAIATQKKAIEKAPEQMKEGLEKALKDYEAKAK
jgi:tetratricopeptide (TPR) repeat protein